MHIIFKQHAQHLQDKYTVLDLDTFQLPDGTLHTACCVVENMPISELTQAEHFKKLHADLISNYGQRNWNYCEQAIDHLVGKWGGELDSFYHELQNRIAGLKELSLDDSWSPIIIKNQM